MKQTILIVEDEPAIVDTIQYALETDGFDTFNVSSGEEAIGFLPKHKIDLIVLDIGLPDMNGFELCKEVRRHSTIPIIFLTARSDEIDRVVGLEIGADDYVVKPFSPRELAARVKAVLRRTENSLPTVTAKVDTPFEIDEGKCQISYYGTTLVLSRYEYRLLVVLLQRPGNVLSRHQLMDLAWDEPDSSMDRTVDAHIKNLRAKLKAVDSTVDPIVTHRGLGYSLKENL